MGGPRREGGRVDGRGSNTIAPAVGSRPSQRSGTTGRIGTCRRQRSGYDEGYGRAPQRHPLHPTSLPGDGTGDLGAHAYRFVDWLAAAGQTLWQVLPLVAVGEGGSPYNGLSAFAGNTLLLSAT